MKLRSADLSASFLRFFSGLTGSRGGGGDSLFRLKYGFCAYHPESFYFSLYLHGIQFKLLSRAEDSRA